MSQADSPSPPLPCSSNAPKYSPVPSVDYKAINSYRKYTPQRTKWELGMLIPFRTSKSLVHPTFKESKFCDTGKKDDRSRSPAPVFEDTKMKRLMTSQDQQKTEMRSRSLGAGTSSCAWNQNNRAMLEAVSKQQHFVFHTARDFARVLELSPKLREVQVLTLF